MITAGIRIDRDTFGKQLDQSGWFFKYLSGIPQGEVRLYIQPGSFCEVSGGQNLEGFQARQ